MSVAKNIKRIRQEKGLTQKELGEKLGISQEAISLMEIGARKPKVDTAKKNRRCFKRIRNGYYRAM